MASIFTKIVQGEIPCYKIAEDQNHLAFLDISPLKAGHTLVIPKREEDYIFDLEDDELSQLIVFAKKVGTALKKVTGQRIGLTVIGLEVPHTHIHLIPIRSVRDMNFGSGGTKLPEEEMSQLAREIASQFDADYSS